MKVAQFIVSFLVLAMGWDAACGDERAYVEIRWIDHGVPSIEFAQEEMPRVSLPVVLQKAIEHEFQNYRVPESQDYEGGWAESYDYVSPEQREGKAPISRKQLLSQKVPFLTLGDFNHDGMQDVAVLLVGKKQKNAWKLVVFHGRKAGYQPAVLVLASNRRRNGVPKNNDPSPVTIFHISTGAKCGDGQECLELGVSEAAGFEYIWKKGRYVEVNTHD